MENILERIVYFIIVPLMYIVVIVLAMVLIARARTGEMRARSILGAIGGILLALVFIILDKTTIGFAKIVLNPRDFYTVVPCGLAGALLGFLLLLIIDLLLQRGAVSFVVFFLIGASVVSAYFFMTASEMRSVISVSTIMFVLGNIIYVMMNFKLVSRALSIGESKEENASSSKWKL